MPRLHWIGKDKVENHHLDVPYKVLEHQYGFTADEGKTETPANSGNKIIKGDNLEALKALLPEYEGKIKCIYIDPPYNTGNEGWVYSDNVNSPTIKKWLGEVVGKEGEDLSRHDKWLCMMYPRLKLLHKLLADDGAIFISIDDNEQAHLKLICDEIFGGNNFVASVIWDLGTGTQAGHFVRAHEHIITYFKDFSKIPNFTGGEGIIEHSALKKISTKNPASNFRFPAGTEFLAPNGFKLIGTWGESEKTTLVEGDLYVENGKLKYDVILSAGWAQKNQMISFFNGETTFDSKGQLVKRFYFNKSGVLRYEKDRSVINPPTVLRNLANTKNGGLENEDIFNSETFSYPKPLELISFIINLNSAPDSIILDSFAGSGTTAHAVMALNKEDGGNRKFILIEMEDYAETITAERVRRVMTGVPESKNFKEGLGGSFDYYELGLPLFHEDGMLNEAVAEQKIRDYIWFTETRSTQLPAPNTNAATLAEQHLLGVHHDCALYFYYLPTEETLFNPAFLSQIQTKAESYIIYADELLLTPEQLRQHNIVFKKIPRDITRL